MAGIGRAFGEFQLPNVRSRNKTPASVYIDAWYSNLEIEQRWSWERYCQLCNLIKMTPYELASLVGMPHADVAQFEEHNHLAVEGRRAVALLLTVVEAHFLSELHHDVIKNPFPSVEGFPHAASPAKR